MAIEKLRFSKGNAKLKNGEYVFSLPAGWSCPAAVTCKSKSYENRMGGTVIMDGKHTEHRCYAATEERYKTVRRARWHNFNLLKAQPTINAMADLINDSMPRAYKGVMRIHASGDFFNKKYFDAWMKVAEKRRDWVFYAYTKSGIPYWVQRGSLPPNVILTASFGGKHDQMINDYALKSCTVVYSREEADAKGLEIDKDDSLARKPFTSFAVLLHGVQPAGSRAAAAMVKLRKKGDTGYAR